MLAMRANVAMLGSSLRGRGDENNKRCIVDDLVVRVGISTTMSRMDTTLMETLESIFSQRWREIDLECVDAVHVHVFAGEEAYPIKKALKRGMTVAEKASRSVGVSAAVHASNLHFEHVPREWYSSAKLLGLLRVSGTSENVTTARDDAREPLLVIADDDMVYDSLWLDTLLMHHLRNPNDAVGFRGWRIRKGMSYGIASPPYEGVWGSFLAVETYVVTGEKIWRPYRVGVATGGCGLALKPSFFTQGVFAPPPDAPNGIMLVDDIWINGNLAMGKIARRVVPIRKDSRHLGQRASVIDPLLKSVAGTPSRSLLNVRAVKFFAPHWERDILYDTSEGPPRTWRRFYAPRVAFSKLLLWLHSFRFIRRIVPDFFF